MPRKAIEQRIHHLSGPELISIGLLLRIKSSIELSLYDLDADPGETTNVIADHADIVARLQTLGEQAREDLGDSLTNREGKNVREPGRLAAVTTTATSPAASSSAR